MPQILVVTESTAEDSAVVYRERISSADLESAHFSGQLVERVGWAVQDADQFERAVADGDRESASHSSPSPREADRSSSRREGSDGGEERRSGTEQGRRRAAEGGDSRPWLVDVAGEDQR